MLPGDIVSLYARDKFSGDITAGKFKFGFKVFIHIKLYAIPVITIIISPYKRFTWQSAFTITDVITDVVSITRIFHALHVCILAMFLPAIRNGSMCEDRAKLEKSSLIGRVAKATECLRV